MFNESYSECFEDVELNILIKSKGFINYTDSGLVSYHLESETRGVNQNKINLDYIDNLHNFLIKIFDKIKKDIFYV
jgi:hypothetical protein